MTEAEFAQALQESVNDVLEKMFFIRSLDEPPNMVLEPEVAARLTFEGEPSGSLSLRVTAAAARSVAADFLGVEEHDLSENEIGEVVCELANMICGSVLSRVESSVTFRLSSPEIYHAAPEDAVEKQNATPFSTRHSVGLGGGAMVVAMDTQIAQCLSTRR